jgi:glycine/D-amino acid oxidase-like deaminating enzyme
MTFKPFPVANSITPYWRSEPDSLDNHRSAKSFPEKTDIVVIGAGYAGASIAYHLLEEGEPSERPSIVILEARQVCSGATGRNGEEHFLPLRPAMRCVMSANRLPTGGHLKPDVYNFVGTVAERYGGEAAAELAAFECAHIPAIESVVEKEGIQCDLQVSQAHDVQLDEAHTAKLYNAYKSLIDSGSALTSTASYTTGEEAERVSLHVCCCCCCIA